MCSVLNVQSSTFNVFFLAHLLGAYAIRTRGVVRRLMQTFENLFLQNCATKFLYITYK